MRYRCNRVWLAAVVLAIILNLTLTSAKADPLSGTRTIGPGGDYASITAAIADIQTQTLGGALVLELQSNYVSTVETFPITFSNLTTTAANTLTLRPQIGATNLLITSADSTAATVDLNGAQFVTIDGRPGGVGSNIGSGGGAVSQLTIANTSTSGRALRFVNVATSNTVTYTTLRGMNSTSSVSSVVFFGFVMDSHNQNNTLDHCDIGDSSKQPFNGIYASGANSGNTIANCNIFNFYSVAAVQYGIWLDNGNTNTDWTITGNSFYQTSARSGGALVGAININCPSGNNFVVSNNIIGGVAPNASGFPWSLVGNPNPSATRFIGISLNVGTNTPSTVQGNIIENFSWLTAVNYTTMPGIWGGITVAGGSANVTGNIIGNGGSGAVAVTGAVSGTVATGISSASTNTVIIANNTVSGIQVYGTNNNIATSLTGIQVIAGVNIISNNTVGATNSNASLNAATSGTGIGQVVTGIYSSSSNSTIIAGNYVGGLNNEYTNLPGGHVRGIVTSNGVNTITGNTVHSLFTRSWNPSTDGLASVLGINQSSALPGQIVSKNTVYTLLNTTHSAPVAVIGIFFTGPTSGVNLIERNWVHDLQLLSTNTASQLDGIKFGAGAFTAQNNMVDIGVSTASGASVIGIYDYGADAGRYFYHNSVYVGGSQTAGPYPSAALSSIGGSNVRVFQNNIFVNARSKSGSSTGSPYAVWQVGADLTGLTEDGNVLLASGTGGVLGRFSSTGYTTLGGWQAATGQDGTSLTGNPLFINPTGSSTTADLHIFTNSPAVNAGQAIGVMNDFDGDPRDATTPTIGADEINYYTLAPGYGLLSAQLPGGGTNALGFLGLPNSSYALEMATNLVPPVLWQPLLTNNADTNGWLFFTNVTSQSPVFYRARFVP